MGELLAYATLLQDGYSVRISGQDVERGTFSHRHAVVKTEDDEEEVIPLNLLSKSQGKFDIYNSYLSEYAVLGFDYGYAFNTPNGLTIWEAQFGDFFNGAQIIIDQFLSAAEDKWGTPNGLYRCFYRMDMKVWVLSIHQGEWSAFFSFVLNIICKWLIVRLLQIIFHLLRRQLKWPFRKPLVVFTPKKIIKISKSCFFFN